MSKLALALIRAAKESQSTFLDLGNCGLTELPNALFELIDLEVLCLSIEARYYDDNQKWVRFKTRNKDAVNYIHSFPQEMCQLAKLKVLLASGYKGNEWQVSDLSPLQGLDNLQSLVVYNTHVSNLSPLKGLSNLQMLDV